MAYRRRRSYKRFFRSKRKSVSWSKEQLQMFNFFRASTVDGVPPFSISLPICTNGQSSNVSYNIAAGSGVRTVKNFTISGAIKLAGTDDIDPQPPFRNLQQGPYSGFGSNISVQSTADNPTAITGIEQQPVQEQGKVGKVIQSYLNSNQNITRDVPMDQFDTTSILTVPVTWALIYVPQNGKIPYLSNASYASIYEPNQNVIDCGIWTPSAGPLRIRSRMARKLHSGDSVYFCAFLWHNKVNILPDADIGLITTISFCTKCN